LAELGQMHYRRNINERGHLKVFCEDTGHGEMRKTPVNPAKLKKQRLNQSLIIYFLVTSQTHFVKKEN